MHEDEKLSSYGQIWLLINSELHQIFGNFEQSVDFTTHPTPTLPSQCRSLLFLNILYDFGICILYNSISSLKDMFFMSTCEQYIDYCSIQIAMNNAFWNIANSNVQSKSRLCNVYVYCMLTFSNPEKKIFPKV